MTTKLYRSTSDKKIFGVCGGLGQALNVDSTLLRFIVVVATIFSGGTAGLLYVVAGLVIPEEPVSYFSHHNNHQHANPHHGYGMNDKSHTGHSHQDEAWGKDWARDWAEWGKEMGKDWGDWAKEMSKSWKETWGSGEDPKHKKDSDSFADEAGYGPQARPGSHMSSMDPHAGPTKGTGAGAAAQQSNQDELDALMREVEAKALRKEIEELKQRLAKFEEEKGEK